MQDGNPKFRISGHETFALRYAWLPKCVRALLADKALFGGEDQAMVTLGVGKNMVRAIRFWAEMAGIIELNGKGLHAVTTLGEQVLNSTSGLDPFLEDDQTLWLLHWQLSTHKEPLFAWDFLLNHWHEPELVPNVIISAAIRRLQEMGQAVSESSLRSHFGVFFHTYYPTRGTKSTSEESLDCPLVELGLIEHRCDRRTAGGKVETVFAFRRGRKPEIGDGLFFYATLDYWRNTCPNEKTLSFRQLAYGPGGPGQVFKLDERDMRARLEMLNTQTALPLSYAASSLTQSLLRQEEISDALMQAALKGVYSR